MIGQGQVRTRRVGGNIDELAASINKVGLLEPIVVVETDDEGRYEILTGQRRFLAHEQLGLPTISCAILSERVDEVTAKVISLTENLVREDLALPDKIDACTFLYKRYGSLQTVAEETGLPMREVREYVKFDRLIEPLKEMVQAGEVDIKNALRAQDAAAASAGAEASENAAEEAVLLAKEMSQMSGAQAEKLKKDREADREAPVESVIEDSKTGGKITQIIVTLTSSIHESLQRYAKAEGQNQDDAAGSLIERALTEEGYLAES